tara:strand:+ start:509 stop:751 length:243 start_codon:yes stop_codon:yes gene_type:complete
MVVQAQHLQLMEHQLQEQVVVVVEKEILMYLVQVVLVAEVMVVQFLIQEQVEQAQLTPAVVEVVVVEHQTTELVALAVQV